MTIAEQKWSRYHFRLLTRQNPPREMSRRLALCEAARAPVSDVQMATKSLLFLLQQKPLWDRKPLWPFG
jgi:hypothetical protein